MELTVILPARNEELLIEGVLKDIASYVSKKGYSFEIIVVINGSSDKTEDKVGRLCKNIPQIRLVKSRSGYGFALKRGLRKQKEISFAFLMSIFTICDL